MCSNTIIHGLKKQLLHFSMQCMENSGVQIFKEKVSHWILDTLHLSFTGIRNAWKWMLHFSDSRMIWQTISVYLNENVVRTAVAILWNYHKEPNDKSCFGLCFSSSHSRYLHLRNDLNANTFHTRKMCWISLLGMTVEVSGDTWMMVFSYSPEAWTRWGKKKFLNVTSAGAGESSVMLCVDAWVQHPPASCLHRVTSVPSVWHSRLWCLYHFLFFLFFFK